MKKNSNKMMTIGAEKGGGGGGGKQAVLSSQRATALPCATAFLLLVVGLPLFLWSVDTSVIRTHFRPSSFLKQQDFVVAVRPTTTSSNDLAPAPAAATAATTTTSPAPQAQENRTTQVSRPPPPPPPPSWISVELEANYTSSLLSRWLTPGGEPCKDSKTTSISIPGLEDTTAPIKLPTGEIHQFVISALDESGKPRCLGGDYFETDLSGDSWKSRPPVKDNGNGSYALSLQVHPNFPGLYNLTVVLLFRSFEGLKFSPERFAFRKEFLHIPITFYTKPSSSFPELNLCRREDFSKEVWTGRWTRHARNDDCGISNDGRYRCLDQNHPCQKPWCDGAVASLESNGWVYSAHCSFKIFTHNDAWDCLKNKWLFFWGDSNHVDTIRNLLNFVLGLPEIKSVPRRFDMNFTNPRNSSDSVRITSVFNGHWNETMNYQGLNSLTDGDFRSLLWKYFTEEGTPDAMVLNSGLHDGVHFMSIRAFAQAAENAAVFWEDVFRYWKEKGKRLPALFYRTTIATGGYARDLAFNPNKMEAFNGVVVEKMKAKGLMDYGGGVVDQFDMTFPWHYDNRCNDGVHYGRAAAKAKWRDGGIGHQYFVDLMLGHVLLNAICNGEHHR